MGVGWRGMGSRREGVWGRGMGGGGRVWGRREGMGSRREGVWGVGGRGYGE